MAAKIWATFQQLPLQRMLELKYHSESDRYLNLKHWCTIHWIKIWLQNKTNFDAEAGCKSNNSCHKKSSRTSGSTTLWTFGGNKACRQYQKVCWLLQGHKSNIVGFDSPDDQLYCFARFERYHFLNKGANAWQLVTSTRHYHLNSVCTKVSLKIATGSSLILTGSLC